MANSEEDFHKEYRQAISRAYKKAHTVKISDRFIAGISDIFHTIPGMGSSWVELKFERRKRTQAAVDLKFPVGLTPLQRNFLRASHAAGGNGGWALCIKGMDDRFWYYFAGNHPDQEVISMSNCATKRAYGEPLDIDALLERIYDPTILLQK